MVTRKSSPVSCIPFRFHGTLVTALTMNEETLKIIREFLFSAEGQIFEQIHEWHYTEERLCQSCYSSWRAREIVSLVKCWSNNAEWQIHTPLTNRMKDGLLLLATLEFVTNVRWTEDQKPSTWVNIDKIMYVFIVRYWIWASAANFSLCEFNFTTLWCKAIDAWQ